jgi:hypothetical protein
VDQTNLKSLPTSGRLSFWTGSGVIHRHHVFDHHVLHLLAATHFRLVVPVEGTLLLSIEILYTRDWHAGCMSLRARFIRPWEMAE